MLNIKEIKELVAMMEKSNLAVFELTQGDARLVLKKGGQEPPAVPVISAPTAPVAVTASVSAAPAAPVDDGTVLITSPVIGTFYRASEPGAEPYVKSGSKVAAGAVVGIVEVMKLFNEVKAETAGIITEILAEDGQMVEYGQPLYRVKKA